MQAVIEIVENSEHIFKDGIGLKLTSQVPFILIKYGPFLTFLKVRPWLRGGNSWEFGVVTLKIGTKNLESCEDVS